MIEAWSFRIRTPLRYWVDKISSFECFLLTMWSTYTNVTIVRSHVKTLSLNTSISPSFRLVDSSNWPGHPPRWSVGPGAIKGWAASGTNECRMSSSHLSCTPNSYPEITNWSCVQPSPRQKRSKTLAEELQEWRWQETLDEVQVFVLSRHERIVSVLKEWVALAAWVIKVRWG